MTFTANFNVRIDGAKSKTIDGLDNVIKQVTWAMIGEEQGQSFELTQTTILPDPNQDDFIDIQSIDEDTLKAWIISSTENLDAIKAHIQYVLDKEIEKNSCAEAQLSWMPIIEKANPPEANLTT